MGGSVGSSAKGVVSSRVSPSAPVSGLAAGAGLAPKSSSGLAPVGSTSGPSSDLGSGSFGALASARGGLGGPSAPHQHPPAQRPRASVAEIQRRLLGFGTRQNVSTRGPPRAWPNHAGLHLVRTEGLGPPRLAPLEPKSSASTSSATFALALFRPWPTKSPVRGVRKTQACGGLFAGRTRATYTGAHG